MRRILLLGKDGQLGWELQRSLAPLAELVALDRTEVPSQGAVAQGADTRQLLCGDLDRLKDLEATVRFLAPDVIVNAAAYTAVDKAETDVEAAHAINATAPGLLASLSAELGAWLVQYSSDYVFDGTGMHPWRETDATGPLSVYGKTKLEGEERIRSSGCRHLILRTSWVYGARGANFVKTMLRLAAEREALRVVDDQIGAPTGADLLADVTAHALRGVEACPALGGTYHVVARGETSWFDYARFVIDTARAGGWSFKVARNGVSPVPSSAYPLPARRPANSRLDCDKFEQAFSLRMPGWQSGVERLLVELSAA